MNFNKLDAEEKAIAEWQYGRCGGFYKAIWSAIEVADKEHLAKIEKGFPVEVAGYKKYTSVSGWWESVQRKLEIF